MPNTYGDISPRTAAFAATKLLDRALPYLCMAKFGQQQPIPRNKTNTVKFRRYNGWSPSTTPLTEGVTPAADNISSTDVTATLAQYGRRTQISDVIADTHEDPVLTEYAEVMGEVAGQTAELVIFNVIRAGTNVIYTGGTSRATVNAALTAQSLQRVIRQLKRQNAKQVTKMLKGTDQVGTVPIRAAFIGFCHPDLQTDLESIVGYTSVANYPSGMAPLGDNELGAFRDLRLMASTLYAPFLAAGALTSTFLSNGVIGTNTAADVYPIVFVGQDAYATVSLAGADAVTPIVLNPGKPSDSDPMGQRGHVAFKMYSTACILNDAYMVRLETAVTA